MRLGKDVLEADLYGELGLLPDATESEIRVAYRRLVRESHPDLNQHDPGAMSRTKRLNVAARVLLDPTLRRTYDRAPRSPHGAAPSRPGPRPTWYERREQNADNDWSVVAPVTPASMSPNERLSFGSFFAELRSRDGQLSLKLQERIAALSAREQLGLAALLCALALGLIAWAHPQGLFDDGLRPTSISVGAVNP